MSSCILMQEKYSLCACGCLRSMTRSPTMLMKYKYGASYHLLKISCTIITITVAYFKNVLVLVNCCKDIFIIKKRNTIFSIHEDKPSTLLVRKGIFFFKCKQHQYSIICQEIELRTHSH